MFDTHPTRTMPHHSANALASADFAKTQTHSAKTALFHRFSPNWSALWRPNSVKSRLCRHQSGGIALHEGATRRRHAARGLRVVQNPRHHRCGGCWRDRRAWLRCPWAAAGSGPDKFRMQFPHGTIQHKPKNRRISTIRLQYLKYTQGNCMRNYRDAVRTQHHTATRPRRCGGRRGEWGSGGPGCGARGRWRGLAGLRGAAPSEARGADDSRAGRRPRAHQAARHAHHAARPKQPGPHAARPTRSPARTQRTQHGARSAVAPRAPRSRVSVAHRLSWMLRPGTASISSRV